MSVLRGRKGQIPSLRRSRRVRSTCKTSTLASSRSHLGECLRRVRMHQELRIIPCTKRVDFAKASVDMVVIDDATIMFLPCDAPVGMLTSEKLVVAGDFQTTWTDGRMARPVAPRKLSSRDGLRLLPDVHGKLRFWGSGVRSWTLFKGGVLGRSFQALLFIVEP